MAARLSGYDDVIVGFDPMNEPYWGGHAITGFEADVLQPFYEKLVKELRDRISPRSSILISVPGMGCPTEWKAMSPSRWMQLIPEISVWP